LSRVVIGGDLFQTVAIRRDPEVVAFSSPINTASVLELDPPSEMLYPFEGCGVDTTWQLLMSRASNLFDFASLADVLFIVDYVALKSWDYEQQVLQSLRPTVSSDRPFTFREQFADPWYDLHNPDQTSTPMTVRFRTVPQDFPPNLDDLRIQCL